MTPERWAAVLLAAMMVIGTLLVWAVFTGWIHPPAPDELGDQLDALVARW